jgi:hypothetical protein
MQNNSKEFLMKIVKQVSEGNNTKITISPSMEEIRVKIPLGNDFEEKHLNNLIDQILFFSDFSSCSYRGKVRIHKGALKVTMAPEKKGTKCFNFSVPY